MTMTVSGMSKIMWQGLRRMNFFSSYICPVNKNIHYILRDLALFSFQIITVPLQLLPWNTVLLVSFVKNSEHERGSRTW